MFGIDDALLLPLVGGLLGAGTSKNPIKGALAGAALGQVGGKLPGMLGMGGAIPPAPPDVAKDVAGTATKTAAPESGGWLSLASKAAGPAATLMDQTASNAAVQPVQLSQRPGPDVASISAIEQQRRQQEMADAQKRRQVYAMGVQGLLGNRSMMG